MKKYTAAFVILLVAIAALLVWLYLRTPSEPVPVEEIAALPAPQQPPALAPEPASPAPEPEVIEPTAEVPEPEPAPEPEVVVPVPAPEPAPEPMQTTRTIPAGGFTPGQPLDVSVTIDYPPTEKPITALAAVELLPRGWEFVQVISDPPPTVSPPAGATGKIEVVWVQIPKFPFDFDYVVKVPEDEGGDTRTIAGRALYRADAGEHNTQERRTPIPKL
jgi:hypothetical protein